MKTTTNALKKIIFSILFFTLSTCTLFAQNGLKAGAKAPTFVVQDNAGKELDLQKLLKTHKSVVLFFYRGQWCPYCNKHIQQLQDSLQLLTDKGAYVIGVTPETNENIAKTIGKTKASFSMVSDKGYAIMKSYDVNFVMEQSLVNQYKKYGVDLEANNGNTDHVLPVPATYIIDKNGTIKYVHFDKDYRKRASVKSLLTML